jgi:S-adenosylmethionine synthetase
MSYIFTSESVSEGHPDKVADQISDAVLDAYLQQDANAKVACEVLITTGLCVIAGEVTSHAKVDAEAIAKEVLHLIGYDSDEVGFNLHTAEFRNALHTQSPEIHSSVVTGGAGDQGLMFGYACNDTPERMPLPIAVSHRIIKRLETLRHDKTLSWLRPDAKSQVSIRYNHKHEAQNVDNIVISTQHAPWISQNEISNALHEFILNPLLDELKLEKTGDVWINPSGSFVIGGPHGDTGLTGRKIIVDTYGGRCPHGGGAFSGKDPSKVDRSAAYMSRFIAKHLLEAANLSQCTVQLSYAIGRSEPTSVYIDTHGDNRYTQQKLVNAVYSIFDLTPQGIIRTLDLKSPIYKVTAKGGHFGNLDLPWEKIHPLFIDDIQKSLSS